MERKKTTWLLLVENTLFVTYKSNLKLFKVFVHGWANSHVKIYHNHMGI